MLKSGKSREFGILLSPFVAFSSSESSDVLPESCQQSQSDSALSALRLCEVAVGRSWHGSIGPATLCGPAAAFL